MLQNASKSAQRGAKMLQNAANCSQKAANETQNGILLKHFEALWSTCDAIWCTFAVF